MFYQMPPYELIDRLFEADDELKGLRWRIDYGPYKAGDLVGAGCRAAGYRRVMVEGRTYAVGRLVWFLRTKNDPGRSIVRHVDGDAKNDCFSNLSLESKNLFNPELPSG